MNDTCLISVIFGLDSSKSTRRIENLKQFCSHITACDMIDHLYIGHVQNEEYELPIDVANVIKLKNSDFLWHKESVFNKLLKLPIIQQYKKIILVDSDIIYSNTRWINETSYLLDQYHICQPFANIHYKSINSQDNDSIIEGTVHSYHKGKNIHYGNGGLVIGYNRDYLNHMGGLYDKCIVGGGDTFNLLPFLSNCGIDEELCNRLCYDIRLDYCNYWLKTKDFLRSNQHKKSCYFLDYNVEHLFHGRLKERNYILRYNLINQLSYYDNFIKDSNGLHLINTSSKNHQLIKNNIKNYFNNRENEPKDYYIWTNNKYSPEIIDNKCFVWLSDNNIFRFVNIDSVKFYFKQLNPIKYAYYIHNNQIYNILFNHNNESTIQIDGPQIIKICSDYNIPLQDGINSDTRKLSFVIDKIEVLPKNQKNFIEYPLFNLY